MALTGTHDRVLRKPGRDREMRFSLFPCPARVCFIKMNCSFYIAALRAHLHQSIPNRCCMLHSSFMWEGGYESQEVMDADIPCEPAGHEEIATENVESSKEF